MSAAEPPPAQPDDPSPEPPPGGAPLTSRIVSAFLTGNLSALLVVVSLLAGAVALFVTPREEDPQIVVPMVDVMVSAPGCSAEEVERQVTTRLEKLLYEVDGVVQAAPSPRFSVTTPEVKGPAAVPGADTDAVLAELGKSDDQIAALRRSGAVA